jgi:hypothetical protein
LQVLADALNADKPLVLSAFIKPLQTKWELIKDKESRYADGGTVLADIYLNNELIVPPHVAAKLVVVDLARRGRSAREGARLRRLARRPGSCRRGVSRLVDDRQS